RPAPLDPRGRPLPGDLRRPLAGRRATGGQREPAGVERGEGDLQPGALPADEVGRRNPHVVEARDAVLDPAQTHEGAAVLHRHPLKPLRSATVIPGESASTTNAEMPPRCPAQAGTRAITTTRSATTPLVVHSLTPLST